MTVKHYAVVAVVGAVLGTVFRGASPWALGALLYTLGFWVRGRPGTPQLLDQSAAAAQAAWHQGRVAWQQFQEAHPGNPYAAGGPYNPPFIQPTTHGAGVEHGVPAQPGVYVASNGRDTIDAGQY